MIVNCYFRLPTLIFTGQARFEYISYKYNYNGLIFIFVYLVFAFLLTICSRLLHLLVVLRKKVFKSLYYFCYTTTYPLVSII